MAGPVAGSVGAARFGVLGPLRVVDADGITWPVRAAKQRVVLAALLLGDGGTVSAQSMSEALWDSCPPPSAPAVMRNYVMRLRVALGPLGGRVVRRPSGWAIMLSGTDELDLTEVERLRSAARVAGQAGDWERVSTLLRTALSHWRGEPLIDVPSAALTRRDASRLAELRLQLTLSRIDADLELGRHTELVPELRRLAADHPLHEHVRVQLMIACYRSGNQAAALDVYRDAHRSLAEELGVAPGLELRETHRRILAADQELSLPPRTADAAVPFVIPRQVPGGTRHFAGRAEELKVLSALADSAGAAGTAVVISAVGGTAGVGKTALAVHWAHKAANRFPDGQLYADLRGWGPAADPVSPADLVIRFLDALGVPADQVPADAEARQALYRSMLAGRRMLIILDNARDAAQVRPLLPGGSSACVVLVTSRSRLASLVAAEAACPMPLDVLTADDADEMLARRLGAERIAAEPDAAREVSELCARLPLALAITASRAALRPAVPLRMLAGELRDASARTAALDAGEGVSVATVFAWSYDHLPDPARRMFRLLGIHPGPDITVAAAASLAAVSLDQAGALLGRLTEAGLLTEHASGRYRFHDLLRDYAAGRARAEDSERRGHAALNRSMSHYLYSAQMAVLRLRPCHVASAPAPPLRGVLPELARDFGQAMAWFAAEEHVLTTLVDQAAGTAFDAQGWQLAMALGLYYERRGHADDALAFRLAALAAARRLGDRHARAQAHCHSGTTLVRVGAYRDAESHYQQALDLYQELGDSAGQALVHLGLAFWADEQGRSREALLHASSSLALSRSTQDLALQANALNNVGWFRARLGDYEHALGYCRESVSMHRKVADGYHGALALDSLGYVQSHLHLHAEAVSSYEQALDMLRQIDARSVEGIILANLADAYEAAGEPRLASQARQRAQVIDEELKTARSA
ncbi:MAG TPA: BTAD domain-containing putative transcriptional regulator [Streptosporangiaceae bacterium]|nr:BTAD domain-containing putative transcriptional regulator [Streptosporangiaceae bacterium]